MKRNSAFIAAVVLLLCTSGAIAQAHEAAPPWKLAATHLEPRSPSSLGDHTLYATFSDKTAARFSVSTVTFMDKVIEVAVNGDRITLIGSGAGPDEAITIDAGSRSVVSRSLALSMRLFAGRWLVSVEWYPNHLFPPQYPNDVVLIQDIQRGEPGCAKKPNDELSQFSALVRAAGRPVYPPKNAAECSYSNIQNHDDFVYRAYPKTFAFTSDGTLIFLTSTGRDRDPQLLSLVQIPLASGWKENVNVIEQSLASVYVDLKLDKNEVLQVDHLEPLIGNAVRIAFSKGAYNVDQAVVPLEGFRGHP